MSDIELWSELASGNGSNSPDGFPEGMAPGGVNNSAREVMAATKGPKIIIQKYKNKTGYKKRQGHRQPRTQVKITSIDA